jgi:pimeloyl-ACP methyl ester carboxylesterase
MFLPAVRKVVAMHYQSAQLFVIPACGHVVNVEQPSTFNRVVIAFVNTNQ